MAQSPLWVWWPRIKEAVEFLSYLAVIVGVFVYFGFEREDMRQNARVEHVLQYIEQFQEGEPAASRNVLTSSWFEHEGELQRLSSGSAPADVIQVWVLKMVREAQRSESKVPPAVMTITEFFDQIDLCVTQRICDAVTAKEYFGPYAERFYCLYKLVIEEFGRKLILPDFGRGVIALAPDRLSCAAADVSQGRQERPVDVKP